MKYPQRQPAVRSPRRGGFTMLELLAVMAIVALLAALLLRGVSGARLAAANAAVKAEITNMASGVANFKSAFGVEPPSHLQLWELGTDLAAATDMESLRTKAILKRLWPQIDVTQMGNLDLNNNGMAGESMISDSLTGAECLVFFLGGVLDSTGTAVTGFSKNPANPFTAQSAGELRDGPFFDFKPGRLVQSPGHNNFKVYIDTLTGQSPPYAPYVYASSYDGTGYLTAASPGSGVVTDVAVSTAVIAGVSSSDLADVYRTTATAGGAPYNPKSFQIISPGRDHLYGYGGYFDPNQSNSGLTSIADSDNITNFNSGPLSSP